MVKYSTRVICDGPTCLELDGRQTEAPGWWGPSIDRVEARRLAARCGWTIGTGRNARDLCPTCTTAAKEAS